MTTRQKILLALLIVIPVIAGLIISLLGAPAADTDLLSGIGQKKIGLITLSDVIYASEEHVKQLKSFREDKSIAGVLLRIDSPGGAVAPSQEIFNEVRRFGDEDKPLVVSMGNVAASGGYYIACPATRIFANPGTITGSIGVIFQFPQYYKLMDKIGVNMVTMKAGAFKDAGNPGREMTEAEKSLLQEIINSTHEQFLRAVSDARDIDLDTLRTFADGRILNGEQALEVRLVDTLGGYEDALSWLKLHCGLGDNAPVIEKVEATGLIRQILSEAITDVFPALKSARTQSGAYFMSELF